MIRFKPLLLMSLLSIIALAILLMLGRWQWEKYTEKSTAAEEPVAEMTIANAAGACLRQCNSAIRSCS